MISSIYYNGDGSTRIFPVSFKILGDDYVRIYIDDVEIVDKTTYDIINNSIVFNSDNIPPVGEDNVKIYVATSTSELGDLGAPYADITSVANNLDDVITVSESIEDVNVVADNISSVNNVIANMSYVYDVSSNMTKVAIVSGNMNEVLRVEENIDDINIVKDNIPDINTNADNIADINVTAEAIRGGGEVTGGQFTGGGLTKPLMYTSKFVTADTTIPEGVNALAIDSYTVQDGVTLTIADGSVVKVV